MEWRDEGVILSVRRHGETSAIAEILTSVHGRCLGLVRGGRSRMQRPVLQAGNAVDAVWRARIEEQLGTFVLEPLELRAGAIMQEPFRLAGLSTLSGLAGLLPEREPHQRVYEGLRIVLHAMEQDEVWPALLVRWEMGLLDELGFGLDLTQCAATGVKDNLVYVSPRSGKAVSRQAGEAYKDRLLRLPGFLQANVAAAGLRARLRLKTAWSVGFRAFHAAIASPRRLLGKARLQPLRGAAIMPPLHRDSIRGTSHRPQGTPVPASVIHLIHFGRCRLCRESAWRTPRKSRTVPVSPPKGARRRARGCRTWASTSSCES